MKKILKILLPVISVIGIGAGVSVGIIIKNNNKPEDNPPIVQNEKFTLTIHYPNDTTEIIEKEKDTEIDLTIYQKNIENLTFDGFYLDTDYNNAISFNFKFTQNMNIYAKYVNIEPTHTFETNWSYDENYHYRKCIDSTCSEVSAKNAHTLIEEVNEKYIKSEADYENYAFYYKHCSTCDYISNETFEDSDSIKKRILTVNYIFQEDNISLSNVFYYTQYDSIDYDEIKNYFLEATNPTTNNSYKNNYELIGFIQENEEEVPLTMPEGDITINAIISSKKRTLTISSNIEEDIVIDVLKGDKITLESLNIYKSDNSDYEFVDWYKDEKFEEKFEEFEITENVIIYAKYDLILKLLSDNVESVDTPWYKGCLYSDVDRFRQTINLTFNKEIKNVEICLLYNNNKELSASTDCLNYEGIAYVDGISYVTIDKILEEEYFIIEGFKIIADNKEFIVNYEKIYNVNGFTHYDVILGEITLGSDYSKFLKYYDTFRNDIVYNYVLENNPDIVNNESIYNNFTTEISYNNIEMLEANILLYEDINITSRNQYLSSLFAVYENYNGTFDLNNHTINFIFDGLAGDTMFKNNFGTIYNGNIYIDGLRDATNLNVTKYNGELFNTVTFSSALMERNNGVIKNVKFTIGNFGFNLETKHNIDCIIGTNGNFALVEDCTFNLYMDYIGTKEQKILNPIATSQTGIFREVYRGSQYNWKNPEDVLAEQQLQNLIVNILEINISEELQSKDLVKMIYETDKEILYDYNSMDKPTYFSGGSYYYNGTEYLKFTGSCNYIIENNTSMISFPADCETIKDFNGANYFIYYNSDKNKYYTCDYGYLLPEFNMVAFDTIKCMRDCNGNCKENHIGVWLNNSYMNINCDNLYLNIKTNLIYHTTYNDMSKVVNIELANPKYVDGNYIE